MTNKALACEYSLRRPDFKFLRFFFIIHDFEKTQVTKRLINLMFVLLYFEIFDPSSLHFPRIILMSGRLLSKQQWHEKYKLTLNCLPWALSKAKRHTKKTYFEGGFHQIQGDFMDVWRPTEDPGHSRFGNLDRLLPHVDKLEALTQCLCYTLIMYKNVA